MPQNWPLFSRLKEMQMKAEVSPSETLDLFLEFVRERKLILYPAQEEALLELYDGKNVILNTPTGSGKSLVAAGLHLLSLAQGRRSFYTCPIKALVNEKFLSLCRDFGPEQVGMITGDATVNPGAPILCCTAEILANDALRLGSRARVDDVIMDEFHYYADRERGVAWQVPLLTLPQTRFLLMSATLGDTAFFEKALTGLNGRETAHVFSNERPVPLDFEYSEVPVHERVSKLIHAGKAPIYLVSFTQKECAEEAQNFMSLDICTKDEKRQIALELEGFKFSSPYGKEVQKFLRHGLGLHHAGLLPKYRILIERLAQRGLLKIIFGTDTLGVGVNVPIRTVLFTKLCKFDGEKTTILSIRDFKQIAGRAGRKGFDDRGTVVVQAPEHVIENIRLEQKAEGDPKKTKKLVKRKPPEKGYVPWNRETFEKLVNGQPEQLVSRFKVSHAMLLQVLDRQDEDGCRAMQRMIRKSHEAEKARKQHGKIAFQLFRSLVDRKLIELNPLRVNMHLQEDFSLNQTLSLYLIDTLKLLEPASENYALDALTLVEAILENPDLILRRQLDRLKGERIQELKMAGMEYDQRMEELEKLEYPKPNREFIYDTFNEFSGKHPWVGQENIRPKSIAREMYENYHSFADYIREYDLHRGEGLLLRYLMDVYKTLIQTVPAYAKNEELELMEIYFGTMVRQVDSSLFEEWERIRTGAAASPRTGAAAEETTPEKVSPFEAPLKQQRALQIILRNEVFRLVRALACGDFAAVLEQVEPASEWNPDMLKKLGEEYTNSGHQRICTDTKARAPKNLSIGIEALKAGEKRLKLQQVLVDPEEHNDWLIELELDFEASARENRAVLHLIKIGPV
ncbi:MAG: DEAD/DEAH box helicase [Bdellovibrionales bacterium GWA1_52_35]|nr:MAG: DEAD/DEAH box helicase [Bdellovibrionales bacterium GWA1_52_35]